MQISFLAVVACSEYEQRWFRRRSQVEQAVWESKHARSNKKASSSSPWHPIVRMQTPEEAWCCSSVASPTRPSSWQQQQPGCGCGERAVGLYAIAAGLPPTHGSWMTGCRSAHRLGCRSNTWWRRVWATDTWQPSEPLESLQNWYRLKIVL